MGITEDPSAAAGGHKRKPSRDIPRHSQPPNEKNLHVVDMTNMPKVMEEVTERLHGACQLNSDKNIASSSKYLNTPPPPMSDPLRILNSVDMDAVTPSNDASSATNDTPIVPKDNRPIQPDSQREYFERLWAENFERSQIQTTTEARTREASQYVPVGTNAELIRINGYSLARDPSGRLYTVFRLEMECRATDKRWTVYRRYQDFKQLFDQLKAQGYRLPLLPSKTILRSFDADFLQKRQADLQKWMFSVLTPKSATFFADILDSDTLRRFLTHMANDPPPLEEGRQKNTDRSVCSDDRSNIAVGQTAIDHLSVETNEESAESFSGPAKLSVSDFKLLRVVGKGSFGSVLLVQKIDTSELFAMKILSKPTIKKKNQIEHTRTERRVLASISHPFIVKLHYAFQTKSKLYFILDYCPGGDMFFHLSRYGRFPENMAKFYAAEIALALIHLHENQIVYRDLKPENIMLGVDGHVKLADFGLAKEGIAETYTLCGTPEYLPPEILNRKGHNRAVDWWNLGMVLYELLSGRPPWYTTDRMKLFMRLRKAKLEFPDDIMSPEAMSLIEGLLDRDPITRLGSNSAEEILRHPFFAEVDWQKLYDREIKPPFQPCQNSDPTEAANFESVFTDIPIGEENTENPGIVTPSGRGSALRTMSYTFQGFTYEGQW